MIKMSYQDEQRQKQNDPYIPQLATVTSAAADGLQIKFDGESIASSKKYKYNKSITFKVGDRVKVSKISGTYLVEYPIS